MKTTIAIQVEKGADKFTVSIPATVIGDYAYHHPYSEEGGAKTWVITHIPSGLALPISDIWSIKNQKQAKEIITIYQDEFPNGLEWNERYLPHLDITVRGLAKRPNLRRRITEVLAR